MYGLYHSTVNSPCSWYSFIKLSMNTVTDHLCGLVIGVPGYRSRGPGSIPGTTRFYEVLMMWHEIKLPSICCCWSIQNIKLARSFKYLWDNTCPHVLDLTFTCYDTKLNYLENAFGRSKTSNYPQIVKVLVETIYALLDLVFWWCDTKLNYLENVVGRSRTSNYSPDHSSTCGDNTCQHMLDFRFWWCDTRLNYLENVVGRSKTSNYPQMVKVLLGQHMSTYFRFEVLTAVSMEVAVFRDVAPCSPYVNRRFGGT
jgi:hypothetical protein